MITDFLKDSCTILVFACSLVHQFLSLLLLLLLFFVIVVVIVVVVIIIIIIRLHRSTTYVDAACCYRWSSVVCPSVRLSRL